MRIAYRTETTQQDGLYRGTCPTVPAVSATACTPLDLRAALRESLADALAVRIKDRLNLPRPGRGSNAEMLEPPALLAAKLALYRTMRVQNLSNVALAKRLGTVEGTVRRLLDPHHRSHINQVEAALAHLGKRLLVEMRDI